MRLESDNQVVRALRVDREHALLELIARLEAELAALLERVAWMEGGA
jgi:hypothetical protein